VYTRKDQTKNGNQAWRRFGARTVNAITSTDVSTTSVYCYGVSGATGYALNFRPVPTIFITISTERELLSGGMSLRPDNSRDAAAGVEQFSARTRRRPDVRFVSFVDALRAETEEKRRRWLKTGRNYAGSDGNNGSDNGRDGPTTAPKVGGDRWWLPCEKCRRIRAEFVGNVVRNRERQCRE